MSVNFEYLNTKIYEEYFKPYSLGCFELKNRFIVAPMCTYMAKDSKVTMDHLVHYQSLAKGGSSLVCVEATAVCKDGRISNKDLVLENASDLKYFEKLSSCIKKQNALAVLQISHAGRKSKSQDYTYSTSTLKFSEDDCNVKILSEEQLDELVIKFVKTAVLAKEAGFDGVEIHAAHGYLIHQSLSPLTNMRTDKYADRNMFLKLIVKTIKENVDIPIIVRFSITEYVDGGITIDDTINTIKDISEYIDVISISSGGGVEKFNILQFPGYQLDMASIAKISTQKPTIAAGLLHSPEIINYALYTGKCDAIAIGRANLKNPNFINTL